MQNTKLLNTLAKFNKSDWMSFRKFLLMHTKENSENYVLFRLLQKNKQDFTALKSTADFRKKYFKKLSEKAFFVLIHKLYSWVEDWLVYDEMKQTRGAQEMFLIKGLIRKGLVTEAHRKIEKLESKILQEDKFDWNLSKILTDLYHQYYFSGMQKDKNKSAIILNKLVSQFIRFYREHSELYRTTMVNRDLMYNDVDQRQIELLTRSAGNLEHTQLSEMLQKIGKLVTNKGMNLDGFEELYQSVLKSRYRENSQTEEVIFTYTQLLARKFLMAGKFNDGDIMVQLQDFQFSRAIALTKGKIKQISYHNSVDQIANFSTFERTKEFIDTWIVKVDTIQLYETRELAYAQNYFVARQFDEMLLKTRFVSFNFFDQKSRAWLLNVIGHFAFRKKDFILAQESIDNYRRFLRRNQRHFSPLIYRSQINLLNIMQLLMKALHNEVTIDLTEYDVIFYRKWITEEVLKMQNKQA